jgi:hypothetical protein
VIVVTVLVVPSWVVPCGLEILSSSTIWEVTSPMFEFLVTLLIFLIMVHEKIKILLWIRLIHLDGTIGFGMNCFLAS